MKRYFALLLAAMFVFAICACAGKNPNEAMNTPGTTDEAPESTQKATEPAETEPDVTEPEATEAPEPTEEPIPETAPEFLDVECLYVDGYSCGDGQKYATYHVETVYLMDENETRHELDGTLGMSSFARTNTLYDKYHELLNGRSAAEVDPADPMSTYLWSGAYLRRADDKMVSVLYSTKYRGKDVENSYFGCFNASSEGRELELGDVIADRDIFLACVNAELEAYGELSITEEDMGELVWVMDHGCMTVYFAVESGRFDAIAAVCPFVTLWYSAHPIMFNKEYLPEGTIHSAMFPMDAPYCFEVEGKKRAVSVSREADNGGDTGNVLIMLDGKAFLFAAPTAGSVLTPNYFMHTAYGDFILVEAAEDGNDATPVTPLLHVFAVTDSGIEYRSCFNGGMRRWDGMNNTETLYAFYKQLPTDPRAFCVNESLYGQLSPALYPLNGVPAWRSCRMGADGMPEPLEDVYRIDGEHLLLIKTAFTADKLNDAGETEGGADIYARMVLQYLATDGRSYIDMYVYEMDIRVRLYIEDGGARVNGFAPDELWTYVTDGVAVG